MPLTNAKHQVLMAVAMKMRQQVPPGGGTFLEDHGVTFQTAALLSHRRTNLIFQSKHLTAKIPNLQLQKHVVYWKNMLLPNTTKKTALLFDPDFGFWHLRKCASPTVLIFRLQVSHFFLIDKHTAR
jgi:hypothetical protein